MTKYQQYRAGIQEDSEVNEDRLKLKICKENSKDPKNNHQRKKIKTGARPRQPGGLELRFRNEMPNPGL